MVSAQRDSQCECGRVGDGALERPKPGAIYDFIDETPISDIALRGLVDSMQAQGQVDEFLRHVSLAYEQRSTVIVTDLTDSMISEM